ncbi:MAG: hypothetical protein DRJ31_08725 [Candidatus Methanomethylicota archaeon]|uniref:Uncharacterized protein n=1 Tax=Thermoproteota archaeon TaxID=2056631 RepID=A0A497EL44_9CREN|nr:MAG: hypothetical protein DRJ31_08725 [Candidatus Verstraetearchaeota archaeon]
MEGGGKVGLFEIEKKRDKKVYYLGDLKLIKLPPKVTRSGNIGQRIIIEGGPKTTIIDALYVFRRTKNGGKYVKTLRIQQRETIIFLEINAFLFRLIEESFTEELPQFFKKLQEKVMKNDRGV